MEEYSIRKKVWSDLETKAIAACALGCAFVVSAPVLGWGNRLGTSFTLPEVFLVLLSALGLFSILFPTERVTESIGFLQGLTALAFLLQPGMVNSIPWPESWELVSLRQALPLPSGISFALGGAGFFFFRRCGSYGPTVLSSLGAAITAVGCVYFALLFTEVVTSPIWNNLDPLAMPVTLALVCVGLSLKFWATRLERAERPHHVHWIAVPVALGLSVFCLLIGRVLETRETFRRERNLQQTSSQLRDQLWHRAEMQLIPLLESANRWRANGRPDKRTWEKEGLEAVRRFPAIDEMAWVDGHFKKQWSFRQQLSPLHQEEAEILPFDFTPPEIKGFVEGPLVGSPTGMLSLFYLPNKTGHCAIFTPLRITGRSDGLLAAVVHKERFFETIFSREGFDGYAVSVFESGSELYSNFSNESLKSGEFAESDLSAFGLPWVVRVWANSPEIQSGYSRLPSLFLLFSMLLTVIMSFMAHFSQTSRRNARETMRINRELAESEDFLRKQSLELIEAREVALEASKMKSEFLANMSHEIRTPMNAVIGLAELMLGTKMNREQKEFTTTIRASCRALLELINDVLDFSKIEAGKMELENVDFDLISLVQSCTEMFVHAAKQKKVTMTTSFSPALPQIVKGDPGRLRQVLVNLVGNAVKFTQKGKISVRVTEADGPKKDGRSYVKFSVTDTGVGISENVAERIFEDFVQGEPSTNRQYGGSGLGLSISRRLVELMIGSSEDGTTGQGINIESEEGRGSTFWFVLSFESGAEISRTEQAHQKRAVKNRHAKHILVVEDDPIGQKVAVKLLSRLEYQVEAVSNGQAAVEAFEAGKFDAILMDCQLPVMDGYRATEAIRELEWGTGRRIPIIALTANSMPGDKQRCLEMGMDAYLLKPVQLEILADTVDRFLSRKTAPIRLKGRKPKGKKKKPSYLKGDRVMTDAILDRQILRDLLLMQQVEPSGFLKGLFQLFLDDTPRQMWKMRAATAQKNRPLVAQLAHSLRSSCSHLAAGAMSFTCRDIESLANNEQWDKVLKELTVLETQYRDTQIAWESEFKKLGRKAA